MSQQASNGSSTAALPPSGGATATVSWTPFIVAVVVLVAAAIGWNGTLRLLGMAMAKERVELKQSLDTFPELIGRFQLANHGEFPDPSVKDGKIRLEDDVVGILGTTDYITWIYRDTSKPLGDSAVFISVHMAYYTGLLDPVPHVAETCQVAGGAVEDKKNSYPVKWTAAGLGEQWGKWGDITANRSAFVRKNAAGQTINSVVCYLFSVNGEPVASRDTVRLRLMDPRKKYSYYMKIELSPMGANLTAQESDEVCKAFYAAAAKEILGRLASPSDIKELEARRR